MKRRRLLGFIYTKSQPELNEEKKNRFERRRLLGFIYTRSQPEKFCSSLDLTSRSTLHKTGSTSHEAGGKEATADHGSRLFYTRTIFSPSLTAWRRVAEQGIGEAAKDKMLPSLGLRQRLAAGCLRDYLSAYQTPQPKFLGDDFF